MGMSNNLALYGDVQSILDAALEYGGGEYEASDGRAAHRLRMRMNHYRKLLQEQSSNGHSPYDNFVFRLADTTIIIEARPALGTFRSPKGKAVALEEGAKSDGLEKAAESVKLGLKKKGKKR